MRYILLLLLDLCVYSHVVVLGLYVTLYLTLCGGCGDCDACAVVCEYAERVRG